ncbi:potassium-transporting ATPase subunit F [Devosia sediminis]
MPSRGFWRGCSAMLTWLWGLGALAIAVYMVVALFRPDKL